jgi:hypothetical protein
MNAKVIGALLVGLVIGAIIGYLFAPKSGLQQGQGKGGGHGINPPIQAYIALQQDGTCRQTVGPDQFDFVSILRNGEQNIEWMGNGAVTAPKVTFPQVGVPFAENSFSGEADSGAVTRTTPLNTDYPYSSVSVFNPSTKQWVQCDLNVHPMGVHVSN